MPAQAGTLPESTMEEKKVEPEAMPEVNPESVPAGDLGINNKKKSFHISHNMGERLDQTHEKNVETRMLLECKPTQILSDFLQAPQKPLEMIKENCPVKFALSSQVWQTYWITTRVRNRKMRDLLVYMLRVHNPESLDLDCSYEDNS